jgi:hypothetical protein
MLAKSFVANLQVNGRVQVRQALLLGVGDRRTDVAERVDHGVHLSIAQQVRRRDAVQLCPRGGPLSLRLVDHIDQRGRVHPHGCPVIVAKRNGLLDERIYKQRAGGLDRTRAHHHFLIMLLIMDTAET